MFFLSTLGASHNIQLSIFNNHPMINSSIFNDYLYWVLIVNCWLLFYWLPITGYLLLSLCGISEAILDEIDTSEYLPRFAKLQRGLSRLCALPRWTGRKDAHVWLCFWIASGVPPRKDRLCFRLRLLRNTSQRRWTKVKS